MKKEKYIISRKFIGSLLLKNIMMFGVVILAVAAPMFMQPDKTSAAKKKTKQTQEYVSMSYKKGVLTIKGKGEMGDPIKTTVYENKNIKVPIALIPFWSKEGEELYYDDGKFNRILS